MSDFETDYENRFFKAEKTSLTSLPSSNHSKAVNSATSTPKLWQKVSSLTYLNDLANYTTLPPAYKKSSPTASAKLREFFLKDSLLFYTESSSKGKLRGTLDLNFSYIRIQKLEEPETAEGKQNIPIAFRISIEKGHRFTSIYFTDRSAANTWLTFIKHLCLKRNFHEEFEVLRKIGEGSFASVYKVSRRLDNKNFAVKAFPKLKYAEKTEMVKNEILALQKLRGIRQFVELDSLYETERTVYLVMEHVEGLPIMETADFKSNYTQVERASFLSQAAVAISILEQRGIVHRDLKPENLLIQESGELKIIDFGLAIVKKEEEMKGDGLVRRAGTPGFVPPELLVPKQNFWPLENYDTKTDIYAIGIVHYCMVTQQHPFYAEDSGGILLKNYKGEIDFSDEKIQALNYEERGIMRAMLEKSRAARTDIGGLRWLVKGLNLATKQKLN